MKAKELIKQLIKQIWCFIANGHEIESGDIHEGTICESHSWCKHCGKEM